VQFMVLARRRTERFSEADFAPVLDDEADRARALYAQGVIRQIWSRADEPGACMLAEAATEQELRTTLDELPLVAAEMLEIEHIVPLAPYRGFCPPT
jgi:muconolactone delta-isomerase